MTSSIVPRRSSRNKRQTIFFEPAFTSPAVKRVKVDSRSTAVLKEKNQAYHEDTAILTGIPAITSIGTSAAISIDTLTATSIGIPAAISIDTLAATSTGILAIQDINVSAKTLAGPEEIQEIKISSVITAENVESQDLMNRTITSLENPEVFSTIASTGLSITSADNLSYNQAGTSAGTEKPLPFGNPPAWSDVRYSLLTIPSAIGRLLTFCRTVRLSARPWSTSVLMRDQCTTMTNSVTDFFLISPPPMVNTWMRRSLSSERKPITPYTCTSTNLGSPGACAMTNQRVRSQTKSQTAESALVDVFLNNQAQLVPFVVIIGKHLYYVFLNGMLTSTRVQALPFTEHHAAPIQHWCAFSRHRCLGGDEWRICGLQLPPPKGEPPREELVGSSGFSLASLFSRLSH